MKIIKNLILIIVAFLFINYSGFCQIKDAEPKQNSNLYDSLKIETDEYNIKIEDVVSNEKYIKFKIRITNKTSDYILFEGGECVCITETKTITTVEKHVFIEPYFTRSRVLEFKGTDGLSFDKFSIEIKGLYRVPVGEKIFKSPDFQIPISLKDFKAGKFECAFQSTKQETQSMWMKFSCKYNGEKIGFINPSKCVVKFSDGKEFAAINLKSHPEMMFPGDESKFTVDFQIPAKTTDIPMVNMSIVWNDVFSESAAIPLPNKRVKIEIDLSETEEINK